MVEIIKELTQEILSKRDSDGCWNVLNPGDKWYPQLNYYVPNYKSTLWTLILLADIEAKAEQEAFLVPLTTISNHFYDSLHKIFTIGKSHFPIPCLNGNLIYLHSYFGSGETKLNEVIDFFLQYQRFDDGDFKTPRAAPYFSNKSCYGKHTCYWGIVKLFKGLSFIPQEKRSSKAKTLIQKCIDFILLHQVCFRSHNPKEFIHKGIELLTFPHFYGTDFLEILWLLKLEGVNAREMDGALALLRSKSKDGFNWEIDRPHRDLVIPLNNKNFLNELISKRAREVLGYK